MTLWFLVTRPLVHHTGEASSTIHTTSPPAHSNTECMNTCTQCAWLQHSWLTDIKRENKSGLNYPCLYREPKVTNNLWRCFLFAKVACIQASVLSWVSTEMFLHHAMFFTPCFWSSSNMVRCCKKDVPTTSQQAPNNQVPKFSAACHVFSTWFH